MTPEEIARIEKEEKELIKSWSEELSEDELLVRLEASANDMRSKADTLEGPIAGLEALARIVKRYQKPVAEVIRAIRSKTTTTPEESQALDAWNRYIREN